MKALAGHALHLALVVLVGAVHVEELHAGDALEQILAVGPQIEHLLGITVHVEGTQGKRGQQAVGKAVRTVAVGRRAARVDEARALLKGVTADHLAVMQIVVHQEIGVAFRSGRTRPHVDDGLDLLRGTAFQHHAPEFVTVYVVPVPTVDEVTPFLAGSQIVHNQNIVDARFVEPPDHGAPDEARTACYDVHGHSLKMQ